MTKEDVIESSRDELKELGIYKPYKEVWLEIYAQSYVDYLRACKEADKHGEINESKNGMTQVNAYHTQKNHYQAQVKQWGEKLFKDDKLRKEKKKDESEEGLNSLLKKGN